MRVRDVLRRLQDDGWYVDRMRGSHRPLKHPTKPGVVTVTGKPNDDRSRAMYWARGRLSEKRV
jgi:predicted RNA binding protein YcfA (HicA-like mRNA interferase family)